MSETPIEDQLAKAAAISGSESDPLAQYAEDYSDSGIDFFEIYTDQSLSKKGLKQTTLDQYFRAFRLWKDFMSQQGRHPAFPNDTHVKKYIEYERNELDNSPATVKNRLRKLERAYNYWTEESRLPHPKDYRPFDLARMKVNLKDGTSKDVWPLSIQQIRDVVSTIKDTRSKVIVSLQFKLGLRATEVSNIQIQDLSLSNHELQSHFDELGSNRRVKGHKDTIYIPSKHERDGNKSDRPRLLPLDDEVRYLLLQYLLIRPSVDTPWVFLSKNSYRKLWRNEINDAWDVFLPEYDETEDYRKITSHYGRHRFSTYWTIEQDFKRELVQYMRGDKVGASMNQREVIDEYIHTNYADIEDIYRQNIFKLEM